MRCAERVIALALLTLAVGCGERDPPRLTATVERTGGAPSATTELRLQLANVGGRTLALDGVGPVCGCAPAGRVPATLAPHASAVLPLRCRPPRVVGEAVREIRVRSSDPHEPTRVVSATIAGIGPGPEPAALYFGYVAVGAAATRDVRLPTAVAVASLPPPADAAFTLAPAIGRPDGVPGVRVRFAPTRPGVVRATLDLGSAVGTLPVSAVAYEGAMAFPAEVQWPAAVGDPTLPVITVVGVGDAALDDPRVEYPPGLGGELRTIVPGRELRLVLRARGGNSGDASGRGSEGAIRFYAASRSAPLLTIPVVAADAVSGAPAT